MKKLKSLIIFALVLFSFLSDISSAMAADNVLWLYKEISAITQTAGKSRYLATKEDCENDRSVYLKLKDAKIFNFQNNITECTSVKVDPMQRNMLITPKLIEGDYISKNNPNQNDEVIGVDPKKNEDSLNNSEYKLLSPIAGFTKAPENVGDYLNKIFILAIGLCVALAVLMMIISGVQYMGEESIFGKVNAKGQIKNALLGLLIALSAYALLNTIDPRLLGKGGVSVKTVTLQIDNETETIPWSEYASTGNIKMCPSGFVDVKTFSVPAKINVCREIAPQLEALIKKADAAGIKISGYGTRSTAQQKKLRIKHGCTDDTTPSNDCKPPTARPGYSMHESGKAIDFNCNGKSMSDSGGQKSPCFTWLSKNASPLLKNLASEPWHWSTTGQ